MLIQSKWQIVLSGNLTLLAIGDYLAAEPKIPRGVQNDVSRPLRSPTAVPLRSYNAEYALGIERVQMFPTDDAAWEGLLLWLNNLPVGPSTGGTITTISGIEYILTNCLVQPGAVAATENNKLRTKFTLTFSQIAYRRRVETGARATIETGAGDPINA